jgi:hypothetical protein
MNEQQPVQILESEQPSEEQKRLVTLFSDMEGKQPDFLDGEGKSIIERIATFLAILFAVTAFGGNFPPKYLVGNTGAKVLVIAILACYLVAMGIGILAIRPRSYNLYRYNVTRMRQEWERILAYKKRLVQWAGILFAIGTIALAVLIVFIILPL